MAANKWDELVHRVQCGAMTPAEAEAEAARCGLEPFAWVPNPEDFDPLTEAWWTLPMAVAWISRRKTDAVRGMWDAYVSQCRHWIFRRSRVGFLGRAVTSGYFLEHRAPPGVLDLVLADLDPGEGNDPVIPAAEARDLLWTALNEGLFEATGIPSSGDRRAAVPSVEWQDLKIVEAHGKEWVMAGQTSYRDVRVRSRSIIALWPQLPVVAHPESLPAIAAPSDAGYMPLYCAAQWIATKGNRETIDPFDPEVWRQPYRDLMDRIASEDVKVIGEREGRREPIPGYHFAGCRVDYPYCDSPFELILSEDLYLRSYPFFGEKEWFDGFDDALENRRGSRWNRIQVHQPDILKFWRFGLEPSVPEASDRTGAPGRPSSMHLIHAEFAARQKRGEVAPSLKAEAAALVAWLARTHSQLPRPTNKTVMNGIRSLYRAYSARK